jgi:hypothetical protein
MQDPGSGPGQARSGIRRGDEYGIFQESLVFPFFFRVSPFRIIFNALRKKQEGNPPALKGGTCGKRSGRSRTPLPATHCRQAEPAGNALAVAVQKRLGFLQDAVPPAKKEGAPHPAG